MSLSNKIRILTNTGEHNSKLKLLNRKTLFLLILTIFSLLPISNNAQSWLDYNYRRALTITNSGSSTLTNYQVLITLTSTNFNNNFPQPDADDIRITTSDGTTLLPYWIEGWSSNQGTIWTKVPSLPVGTTTIYLYYGNNVAVSASNGTNTFELFEDDWIINPVHTTMQPSWEHSVTYPMVFKEPDSTNYYMIWDGHHDSGTAKGFSTSTDLINWTPYANNPIMGFDTLGVNHGGNGIFAWGDAIKVGSTYHIFPSKGPAFTYHAKSTDLITWTGMNGGAAFDSLISDISLGITTGVAILKEGDGITPVTVNGRYWMVYGYSDFYMAWSTDLINWHDANNGSPILNGVTAAWDSIMWTPSFIRIGSTYYIYYQGSETGSAPWHIGYASAPATGAPNTVTWTKAGNNPVLSGGNGWEVNNVAIDPAFRYFDGTYYLFYTGGSNNGFATSSSPGGPWIQNDRWAKDHNYHTNGVPNVSGGIVHIDDAQSVTTVDSFSVGHAVGFRAYFHLVTYFSYKFSGFSFNEVQPYILFQVDNGNPNNLSFYSNDRVHPNKILKLLPATTLSSFHNYEATWSPSLAQAFIDHSFANEITAQVYTGSMPLNFENLFDTTNTFDIDWVYLRKFSYPDPSITTVGAEQLRPLYANLKVFLEGPYAGGGAMSTSLNTNNLIPLNSNTAFSTTTYGYTASVVGSIPNATIVDWVLVELRTGTAAGTKVATRAGFLKSDGTIVDIDGTSLLNFAGVAAGNYYVVIRHRNHLPIMSATALALSISSTLYDFTTAQTQAYTLGTDPMVALTGGGFGLIAADANNSAIVTAADVTPIIVNLNTSVYIGADINMSAIVTASDVTPIITNLNKASNVPN